MRPRGEKPGLSLHIAVYESSRILNDAGRDVSGRLRRHQRCHQGRRRWTRTMNCSTGESHSRRVYW